MQIFALTNLERIKQDKGRTQMAFVNDRNALFNLIPNVRYYVVYFPDLYSLVIQTKYNNIQCVSPTSIVKLTDSSGVSQAKPMCL